MIPYKNEIGGFGENYANNIFLKNKFQLLKKNYKLHRYYEIDLIFKKNHTLYFVEVKTFKNNIKWDYYNVINLHKKKTIKNGIHYFLRCNKQYYNYRIIVLTVFIKMSDIIDFKIFQIDI